MKRFKQFVEETKGDKDIVNGHGLHSLTPKEKKEFLKFKESKHKLKENNSSNFFDKNDNEHLGSNSEEQIQKLHELHPIQSRDHQDELEEYTSHSGDLNDALIEAHKNKQQVPETIKGGATEHNVKKLDDTFQPSKTKLHTYSGVGFNLTKMKPVGISESGNKIYHSPAYISSSLDKTTAADFAGYRSQVQNKTTRPQIIHYETNEGDPISVVGNHSAGPEEKEILHPRDSHFEHIGTSIHKDEDGTEYEVHHVRRIQFDPVKHALHPIKPTPNNPYLKK